MAATCIPRRYTFRKNKLAGNQWLKERACMNWVIKAREELITEPGTKGEIAG